MSSQRVISKLCKSVNLGMRRCTMYIGVSGSAQVRAGVSECKQMCEDVYRYAQMCVSMLGCLGVCIGMCRDAWEFAGMHSCMWMN